MHEKCEWRVAAAAAAVVAAAKCHLSKKTMSLSKTNDFRPEVNEECLVACACEHLTFPIIPIFDRMSNAIR